MAVTVETTAVRYEDISAGTPISVPFPLYEASDVKVYYGIASLEAVYNTDYTITLGEDFDTFTVVPLSSLLTKINALIAADADEVNYITVRRELDNKTDATAAAVRYTPFTAREFERTVLRFQQLQEKLNRAVVLSPNFVGEQPLLQLNEVEPGATLIVNEDGTAIGVGPTASDVINAQANAQIATTKAAEALASAIAAATSESNAATSETNAETSASAAATSESNAATSETNAETSASAAATSESNAATSASEAQAAAAAVSAAGGVSLLSFGAEGDGVANDTTAMADAILFCSNNNSALYIPNGTYLLDEVIIKSGVRLIGQSKTGVILKYSGAAITPKPAHPSVVSVPQIYKAFVRTEQAGNVGSWNVDVGVENLTIDWDNNNAGGYAAVLCWMGNVRGFAVRNLGFAGALPADYVIPTTSAGRGACVFCSYAERGVVERCEFTDEASYEELGIRYYNRDITVRKNRFAGKGPWRHNIEVAAARDLSGVNEWPKGILIEDNLIELHGAKQDVLSCHDGGDVIFRSNRIEVKNDLVDTSQSGVRCLVKRFDNADGIVEGFLLVEGNSFDFRDVPATVKRGFEVVRIWTDNVTVRGNVIRGRTDGFDNSIEDIGFYPWVGTGSNERNPRNVVVSDNIFELYEYSSSVTFQVIKLTGNGAIAHGNVLYVKEPVTVTANGPVFIDLHGSGRAASGGPADGQGGGRANSVFGNASYADEPNAILINVNMRGAPGEAQMAVLGNVSNCAVTNLGSTYFKGGDVHTVEEDGMRVAIANLGAGVNAQEYRYHQFTWNPSSIASGSVAFVDVSVPGASLGDEVTAAFSLDIQYCTLTAYVQSNNTVRVILFNSSASAKDLGSGTVTLRIKNRL